MTRTTSTTKAGNASRPATNTAPVDVAALTDQLHAYGLSLLADPVQRATGDLVVLCMTASGTVGTRKVDGSRFYAQAADNGGLWGLCYKVTNGKPGSVASRGGLWGLANSYASAAADVAIKATDLRNGRDVLAPGSVFTGRAYVVTPADRDAAVDLLRKAFTLWVDTVDALPKPAKRRTRRAASA